MTTLKFPSPKSTFKAFKSVFGAKSSAPSSAQAGAAGGASTARTAYGSVPPGRAPAASAWQSGPAPRQAAPRHAAGGAMPGRPSPASAGASRAPTQGDKLLETLSLLHLDRMTNEQLIEVALFLEGRHRDAGAAANVARLGLPLTGNWQLLRGSFNDVELKTLIARNPLEVLSMLKRPAPRPTPNSQQGQGSGADSANASGARHQWNGTPPRTSPGSASSRGNPGRPPISVLQMGRQAAVAELGARGVQPDELKRMSQAFSAYANFGGEQLAADFKKSYGHLIADDITDHAHRARLGLFFKGLMRINHDA